MKKCQRNAEHVLILHGEPGTKASHNSVTGDVLLDKSNKFRKLFGNPIPSLTLLLSYS